MKVAFKASSDDFVDVIKRSTPRAQAAVWKGIMIYALIFGGVCGIIGQLVFGHWLGALSGFLLGLVVMIGGTWNSSAQSLARYYEGRYKTEWPIDVEVEILQDGISCKHLDHRIIFQWPYVESMEEAGDAIYFRTKFDHVLAVRKRGFASDEEKDAFLKLAGEMMRLMPEN